MFSYSLFADYSIRQYYCDFFFHRPNGRKVVLGVHSLSEPEETQQTFDILELHNHPDFSLFNYDNDIALIKVSVYFVYVSLGSRPTTDL